VDLGAITVKGMEGAPDLLRGFEEKEKIKAKYRTEEKPSLRGLPWTEDEAVKEYDKYVRDLRSTFGGAASKQLMTYAEFLDESRRLFGDEYTPPAGSPAPSSWSKEKEDELQRLQRKSGMKP